MAFRQVMNIGKVCVNSTFRNYCSASKTLSPSASQFLNPMCPPQTCELPPSAKCRPQVLPCPPPHPYCPPVEARPYTRRLLRLLCFLAKVGVFVGITKMTIDEGLWGSAEETEDLVKRMQSAFETEDEAEPQAEKKKEEQPRTTIASLWNSLVVKAGKLFGMQV